MNDHEHDDDDNGDSVDPVPVDPAPEVPAVSHAAHDMNCGLFDGVEVVEYGLSDDPADVTDAYVLKHDGEHSAFLGAFVNGVFQQVNNGDSVPERAEGGGVTYKKKA